MWQLFTRPAQGKIRGEKDMHKSYSVPAKGSRLPISWFYVHVFILVGVKARHRIHPQRCQGLATDIARPPRNALRGATAPAPHPPNGRSVGETPRGLHVEPGAS